MSLISTAFLSLFLLAQFEKTAQMKGTLQGGKTGIPMAHRRNNPSSSGKSMAGPSMVSMTSGRRSDSMSGRLSSQNVLRNWKPVLTRRPLTVPPNAYKMNIGKRLQVTMSMDKEEMIHIPFNENVGQLLFTQGALMFSPGHVSYWYDDHQPSAVKLSVRVSQVGLVANWYVHAPGGNILDQGGVNVNLLQDVVAEGEVTFENVFTKDGNVYHKVKDCNVHIPITITAIGLDDEQKVYVNKIGEFTTYFLNRLMEQAICLTFKSVWNKNPENMPGGGDIMGLTETLKKKGIIVDDLDDLEE